MTTLNAQESAEGIKKLLGQSVEESRVKRLEKQNARYRDRGGIFVPAETNPLLDVLLARGVNGESPSKKRARARLARKSSPAKMKKRLGSHSPLKLSRVVDQPAPVVFNDEQKTLDIDTRPISGKIKTSKVAQKTRNNKLNGGRGLKEPISGSSKQAGVRKTKSSKGFAKHPPEDEDDDVPLRVLKSARAPKHRQTTRPKKSGTLKGKRSEINPDDDEEPTGADLEVGKKDESSAVTKVPREQPVSKLKKKSDDADGSDTAQTTKIERTCKRKGRLKQEGKKEITQEEPINYVRSERVVQRKNTIDATPINPKMNGKPRNLSASLKRPLPATKPDISPRPARKKPRLPTPSDSEDDLPLVIKREAAKALTKLSSIVPVDRPATEGHFERLSGTSGNMKVSKKTTLKRKVNSAIADLPPKRDPPASFQSSIVDQQEREGGPPEASAPDQQPVHATAADERLMRVGGNTHESEVADAVAYSEEVTTKKPVRRSKNQVTDVTYCSSKSTVRVSKRVKEAPVESEAKEVSEEAPPKRLKTISRGEKENRQTSKKVGVVRKPKPRLSMFPTPAMAADSEDELDLLH
ncbi:hypothetical protein BDY19DRAFT_591236 [Irpex rosettiformis]|uniref:Uncharacterized protein n=1 Tax=Irpex rosettiformis TaxID=378272 RepID=A0ACB8UD97_9APHY|nr:hypothetical protein BDY19DRAFT_591236 [Irpex rosettiformis]